MSKRFKKLDGLSFARMIEAGAEVLQEQAEAVNALNVFPVPDGDTGTNMSMTMNSGAEALRKKSTSHAGECAELLSKGLLMGARGNSGVILSQLFRGFAQATKGSAEIDVQQFAEAIHQGVNTAYKAILRPVEGTILTVAREAAKHGLAAAKRSADVNELMHEVLAKAKEALVKTPDQLPVLKQVGVVDAGGQGLVAIYEGFVAALDGERIPREVDAGRPGTVSKESTTGSALPERPVSLSETAHAQFHMMEEEIEFGYCTEFMVRIQPGKTEGAAFDELAFREELEQHGDSVLVVADDELVKVHLHAEYPGEVLTLAQRYGELIKIKIDNMRDQHAQLMDGHRPSADGADLSEDVSAASDTSSMQSGNRKSEASEPGEGAGIGDGDAARPKTYGIVAVAAGEGLEAVFKNLGVDVVLSGGQTMNPSTEDIVGAIDSVNGQTVFVLPNNSNIVLAAQQAAELVDRPVVIIPTKTIPQGMAAMLAFQSGASPERNTKAMEQASLAVQSGQVTYAVRDSQIDGMDIRVGDYLGIHNNKIVVSSPELMETCRQLLQSMMAAGGEVVSVFTGADASESDTLRLTELIEETFAEAELEVLAGGQPVYTYLFSVE